MREGVTKQARAEYEDVTPEILLGKRDDWREGTSISSRSCRYSIISALTSL
jgi:hypothetical protein